MGFIVKTPITEQQRQNEINNKQNEQRLSEMKNELNYKIQETTDFAEQISQDLNAVKSDLEYDISVLQSDVKIINSDIANEVERRALEDTNINGRITSEVALIQSKIDAEHNDMLVAVEGEAVIRAQEINDTRQALIAAIGNSENLQNIENEKFREQMASETALRNAALNDLAAQINSEIANRTAAIATVNGDLLKEIENRTTAIDNLADAFDNATENISATLNTKISATSDTLNVNVANLQSQINSNKTAISKEVTDRQAADNQLQSNLTTAINTEKTARKSAIDDVKTDIQNAVNSLQDFTKTSSGLVPVPPDTTVEQVLTQNGWRDVTATSIYINTTPSQINIPTYDKNSHTAEWLNFDTNKLSISGDTAGVDAKTYVAKFKPTGLYVWGADNTQSEKQVQWIINARKLNKPTLSKNEFDYDANTTYNVLDYVNNYIQKYMTVSGNTGKAIGNYTLKFSLDSKTNTTWSDGSTNDVDIEWEIVQRNLTYEQSTGFNVNQTPTFDGGTTFKLSDILNNYNPEIHVLSGTVQSSNAGTFTATILPAASYNWYDGTRTAKQITWTVNKKSISQPTVTGATSFAHDGAAHTLTVTYDSSWVTLGGDSVTQTNPGDFETTFALKYPANTYYVNSNNTTITVNWNIYRKKLSAALSQNFNQSAALTYNGAEQTVSISNYNSDYHILGGTFKATNAGNYTATITPTTYYDWSDGTHTAKQVNWTINKQTVALFTAKTSYDYTGSNQTLTFTDFNSNIATLSGDTVKSAVGDYVATVTLKDTTNYIFSNGDTKQTVNWSIGKKSITIPTANTTAFTFNGDMKTAVIANYDETVMTSDGTITASDAGTYTITYALKDTATSRWSDNTTTNKQVQWTINRKPLTAAQSTFSQESTLYFDSRTKYANIKNFDATYHTKIGGAYLWWATQAGTYTAKIGVKSNYCFSDGTFNDSTFNCKTCEWTISKAVVNINTAELNQTKTFNGENQEPAFTYTCTEMYNGYATRIEPITKTGTWQASDAGEYTATVALVYPDDSEFSASTETSLTINWKIERKALTAAQSQNFRQGDTLTYNGASQSVYIYNYDSTCHVLGSTTSAVNAGTYTATITPINNYSWSDKTTDAINVNWKINRRQIPAPALTQTDFAYTGDAITAELVAEFNPSLVNQSGNDLTQTAAGSYSRTFTINDTANNEWSDGTTDAKVVEWSIGMTKITPPTLKQGTFTYDENTVHTIEFEGFDSNTMTFNGTVSGRQVESYYVYVYLKDTATTVWSTTNGTSRIVYRWTINRKPVPAANNYDKLTANDLDYTGSAQTADINNFNSTYYSISGNKQTDVGEYTATVTIGSNYCWTDGTTANKYITWKINPIQIAVPALTTDAVITFDNVSHTAAIDNVNTAFMTVAGDDLTQTAPGVYSRTYTLKNTNNTTWAVNDSNEAESPVIVTWEIRKTQFAKPYISKPVSTYCTKISIVNYKSDYMTGGQSGSFTSYAGEYSLTISLQDPLLTEWIDGTNGDITLTYTVLPKPVPSEIKFADSDSIVTYNGATNAVPDFTFDGSTFNILDKVKDNSRSSYYKYFWFDGSGMGMTSGGLIPLSQMRTDTKVSSIFYVSGETTSSDAGVFSLNIDVNKNNCFHDGSTDTKIFTWEVKPAKINKPALDKSTTLTFNGNIQQAPITGYDSTTMTISGTTEASNAGTYTCTIAPDANHTWSDGTTDEVTIKWTINRKYLTSKQSYFFTATNFTYDGQTHTLAAVNRDGDSVLNNPLYQLDLTPASAGTVVAGSPCSETSNVGTYYVSIKPNSNYAWSNGSTYYSHIIWKILAATVQVPTISGDNHFDYDGTTKTIAINNPDNVTGTGTFSAKKNGTYTITYTCPANSEWVDSDGNRQGTEDIVLSWSIGEDGVVAINKPYISSATDFTYSGSAKTITVKNYNSSRMTKSGTTSATVAGDYSVTYKLKTGFVWMDGSTADVTLNWSISKAAVPADYDYTVFAQETALTYNGSEQSVTISGFNATYYTADGLTGTNAGSYTATFTLKDNYTWSDGTTDTKTVNWSIAKKVLPVPTASQTTFQYTGNVIDFKNYVSGFDSDTMEYRITSTGYSTSATDANSRYVYIDIKDTANYIFSNNKTTFKLPWTITPIYLDAPTVNGATEFTFNGDNQGLTFDDFDSATMKISGNSQSDAGSYTTTIALKNKINYRWTGNTTTDLTFDWKINVYTSPYLSYYLGNYTKITYDGTVKKPTIIYNGDNSKCVVKDGVNLFPQFYELTGTLEATDAGEYPFTLTTTKNARWKECEYNKTRTSYTSKWVIYKAKPPALTLSDDYPTVAQGNTISVTVNTPSDGVISAESLNPDIIAVSSVSGNVIRLTGVEQPDSAAEGPAMIKIMQAKGTNYLAADSIMIEAKLTAAPVLMTTSVKSVQTLSTETDELQLAILDIQDAILDIYQNGV